MLGKLKRLHKSKILISLLVALMMVFSFNQSKPKAFVPLAWAGAVLAGMAAETLVTAGVKAGSKAILKKKADDYSAQAVQNGGYDFLGTNPYRNKDGSITLSPSANDRAKMAGIISGALIGSMIGEGACEPTQEEIPGYMPLTKRYMDPNMFGSSQIQAAENAYNGISPYVFGTYDAAAAKIELFSKITGKSMAVVYNQIEEITLLEVASLSNGRYTIEAYTSTGTMKASLTVNQDYWNSQIFKDSVTLATSLGETITPCGGLLIPSSVEHIYPAPPNMSPDYQMPNNDKLQDKPITFYNMLPPGEEGEISWTDIEKYYYESGDDFIENMDGNIETLLTNGDINNHTYTQGDFYNIYTDYDYPEKAETFSPPLAEEITPAPLPDSGEVITVDPVDRSLLQIAKESYQYLADTVKNSVDGLITVTAGAAGVITFLDTVMGWLPEEWRIMYAAAFGLGLFAFFFRR